jgi:RNA polymerase subunit RPABC4/transcription elongation factor Spt4
MAFCTKCGKQMDESARFCPSCGTPVKQTSIQPDQSQEFGGSSVVVRYEKSALFMALTQPLNVSLDGQLNFKVVDGRQVCYNLAQRNHTLHAYVPYIGSSKYGEVRKTFYIGNNETWEITYRPPATMFSTGNIAMRKVK